MKTWAPILAAILMAGCAPDASTRSADTTASDPAAAGLAAADVGAVEEEPTLSELRDLFARGLDLERPVRVEFKESLDYDMSGFGAPEGTTFKMDMEGTSWSDGAERQRTEVTMTARATSGEDSGSSIAGYGLSTAPAASMEASMVSVRNGDKISASMSEPNVWYEERLDDMGTFGNPDQMQALMSGVVQGLVGDESAFSYEGRTTMAERRAFVVTMEPAAGEPPALLPGFVVDSGRVWLDAESGVVLGMDADFTLDALEMFQALSASGGMPGVPDDLESQDLPDIPPMEGSLRWRVTHVAYDEDLADDLFTFVPPPGAHEVSLSDLGAGETGPGSDGEGPETAPSIAGLPEVNTLNAAAAVLDYPVAELDRFPEGCHEVSVQLRPLMSGVHEPDAYIMAMLDCPAGALLVVEAPSASPPRVSPLEALSRADDFTVVTTGRAGTYIQLGASWATPELLAASDGLQAEDR